MGRSRRGGARLAAGRPNANAAPHAARARDWGRASTTASGHAEDGDERSGQQGMSTQSTALAQPEGSVQQAS
eukprot:4617974-Pleurochrysis_carterae.AAC.1